jgi:hypothetical protein
MSAPWQIDLEREGLTLADYEEPSGTVLMSANTLGNLVPIGPNGSTTFVVRPYQKVAIVSHAQAWDAPGNGLTTFRLLVNGAAVYPYEARKVSLSSPFGDTVYLPRPLWIPQLSTVQVSVDLGAATAQVNFTEKLIVYYFNQDPNLLRRQRGAVQGVRSNVAH